MESIKLVLCQVNAKRNIDDNLDKAIECITKAKDLGADIVLFPEMFSNGYNLSDFKKEAISLDSKYINEIKKLAKSLKIAVCITFLENDSDKYKNSLCLFDYNGKMVLHYSKVHTCDFADEKFLTAGDDFYVTTLNTLKGDIKVGAMICYDREFPESARILMLKGAELVLVPNACPMEINRISQLRGRAYENMFAIATCNYPIIHEDCNGHSTVFDGIAYKEGVSGSRDTLLFEADENEGIFLVDIPIDDIRKYREKEVHGNAYRHPSKYHKLIEEKIEKPFIRKDYKN